MKNIQKVDLINHHLRRIKELKAELKECFDSETRKSLQLKIFWKRDAVEELRKN